MNKEALSIAEKSIELELLIAQLYENYYHLFPEDADFWWQMVIEEKGHAAFIKSGIQYFDKAGLFPIDLLAKTIEEIDETRERVLEYQQLIKENPQRELAFHLALKIELSAGEIHFQKFMSQEKDHPILKVFTKLNKDDKDHAKRISAYMKKNGIVD